jgi:hypothetical protein
MVLSNLLFAETQNYFFPLQVRIEFVIAKGKATRTKKSEQPLHKTKNFAKCPSPPCSVFCQLIYRGLSGQKYGIWLHFTLMVHMSTVLLMNVNKCQ